MSVKSHHEKATEKFDPYTNAGRSLRGAENRGSKAPQEHVDREFHGMIGNLRNSEESADRIESLYRSPSASQKNREQNQPRLAANRKKNKNILMNLLTSKKLKGRSSLFTLLLVLFGGGGFLTVFFSPSLAIVQMKEVFTKSLNDQTQAIDARSAALLRSKLKDTTKGSCGAIKIKCRFATMTDRQAAKFKAAGIEIEREPAKLFNYKRGQVTKISYMNEKGVTVINSAADLQKTLLDVKNTEFRSAMLKGYNPHFATLSDKIALGVLRTLKTSKGMVVTGETDNERQQRLNNAVSGVEDLNAKNIVIKTDEDGKELYFDSDGNELSSQEVDAIKEQGDRIKASGGTKNVLSNAIKGVAIIGAADSACTVYNSARFVSALAKVKKKAQAARFAMAMVLTPGDALKAGDISAGDLEFIGNNLTSIRPAGTVLDESKLEQKNSAGNPATVADPEAGLNAFDSPGYKTAAYNDAPDLSLRASQFTIGGGSVLLLDGVIASIAGIVNGGNTDPKGVSDKCRYIQNPAVRLGSLAVGIVAGLGSFGLLTAVGIGGSVAVALALPYIESEMSDIVAGNVFKDLSGIDSGDAAYVGTASVLGDIAMDRGMHPVTNEEGMQYVMNNQAPSDYDITQQQLAKSTPLDIYNKYSFMGSIASTIVPIAQQSKSSASMAMINISSLIPTSFASLVKPANALSTEYFNKCNDQAYQSIGIKAGVFCEVRYYMSSNELAMDSLDNVQWMVDNGEIDPDTGEALPEGAPVADGSWSYAKFLSQCTKRTVGWGENQDENEGDGRNCIDAKYKEQNEHYGVYTMDKSIDESMDAEPIAASQRGSSSYSSGATSTVGADGWALPIPSDFTITSGYESSSRPDHHGIDLASKSAAATNGQPIFAARSGTVTAAGRADGYGNWIVIEHDIDGKKVSTLYGHMYDDGVLVKVGDKVDAGKEIGKVGSNGNSSGPHLHFEIWDGSPLTGGKQVDPTAMFEKAKKDLEAINV